MIDALIGGKVYGKPVERTSKGGNPFVTAKVRTPVAEADTIFVNVIAFAEGARTALLALDDGDSVALSGALTPKVYTPASGGEPRVTLDLVAYAALTPYSVTRKRDAVRQNAAPASSTEAYRQAFAPLPENLP